jgi:hypothetical protein
VTRTESWPKEKIEFANRAGKATAVHIADALVWLSACVLTTNSGERWTGVTGDAATYCGNQAVFWPVAFYGNGIAFFAVGRRLAHSRVRIVSSDATNSVARAFFHSTRDVSCGYEIPRRGFDRRGSVVVTTAIQPDANKQQHEDCLEFRHNTR